MRAEKKKRFKNISSFNFNFNLRRDEKCQICSFRQIQDVGFYSDNEVCFKFNKIKSRRDSIEFAVYLYCSPRTDQYEEKQPVKIVLSLRLLSGRTHTRSPDNRSLPPHLKLLDTLNFGFSSASFNRKSFICGENSWLASQAVETERC